MFVTSRLQCVRNEDAPPARSCCSATPWSSSPSPSTAPPGRRPAPPHRFRPRDRRLFRLRDPRIVTRIDPSANLTLSGPVPVPRRLLHPVRGRGLPAHHPISRPARRDGPLHGAPGGRRRHLPGAALQRQPARNRHAAGRTAATLRPLGRPFPSRPTCSRWSRRICRRWSARSTTMSGREVLLQVWVEARDLDRVVGHAMDSLVHSCAGTRRSSAWNSTSTAS